MRKATTVQARLYYAPNGTKTVFPATLLRDDPYCDLAVFSIETDLEIDDAIRDGPEAGEKVVTVGFPDALQNDAIARVAHGYVIETLFGIQDPQGFLVTKDNRAYPCFLASGLDPTKGSSGSPVYSLAGEIVGYTKGFDDNGNALCYSAKNVIKTLRQLGE